jgi:hypothetical protein
MSDTTLSDKPRVIPAKAGIQVPTADWAPVFAGATPGKKGHSFQGLAPH